MSIPPVTIRHVGRLMNTSTRSVRSMIEAPRSRYRLVRGSSLWAAIPISTSLWLFVSISAGRHSVITAKERSANQTPNPYSLNSVKSATSILPVTPRRSACRGRCSARSRPMLGDRQDPPPRARGQSRLSRPRSSDSAGAPSSIGFRRQDALHRALTAIRPATPTGSTPRLGQSAAGCRSQRLSASSIHWPIKRSR